MRTFPSSKDAAPAETPQGFALVATISLMVLLALVAIGLLSLSTITLRSGSQGRAAAEARANARLGLLLAIGELQKYAGPDQRITATGRIMQEPGASASVAMPHVTGVWQSWQIDPNNPPSSDDYRKNSGKESKFLRWLVSSASPDRTKSHDFVKSYLPQAESVQLMPAMTAGAITYPELTAGVVDLTSESTGVVDGGCAWAVLDEGTKARVNTGYRESQGTQLGNQSLALGSGSRPDISRIQELEAFTWENADVRQPDYALGKGATLATVDLLNKSISGSFNQEIKELGHDITVESMGVFADVANGGLKQDLNSILNDDTLPSDLRNKGIYETQLGYQAASSRKTGDPDPSWTLLQNFSNLYESVETSGGVPYAELTGPSGWALKDSAWPPRNQPEDPVLLPVISKVQVFYSLVACPLKQGNNSDSQPWVFANNKAFKEPWDNGARYLLYMIYTPVVTLHNPYNTTLQFQELAVEFNNVPLSVQISRNGGAYQPASPGGVQSLYQGSRKLGYMKPFKFTIKSPQVSRRDPNPPTYLQPGEMVAFSPDISTRASFQSDRSGPYDDREFVDTMDSGAVSGGVLQGGLQTGDQTAKRGFRGIPVGYALDFLNFGTAPAFPDPPYVTSKNSAFRYAGPRDNFRVKFRPTSDARVASSERGVFRVVMSDGKNSTLTALNFDFSGPTDGNLVTGLEKALGLDDEELIYPAPNEPPLRLAQIAVPRSTTPIVDFPSNAFALITATSKTTMADYDGTNYEGRYATKPWSFTSPIGYYLRQRIEEGSAVHQAQYPYELDAIALSPSTGYGGDDYVNADALGRGNGITGHTSLVGKQFGTAYEIPLAPPQALPQLNSANLAHGSSLSRFLYPIGNSWAHPMIPTSTIFEAAPIADIANQYDHSFLLNLSLYDSFYFSGIASSDEAEFMNPVRRSELAEDFFSATPRMTADTRLTPYLPAGKTTDDAIAELSNPDTARTGAASYQLMKGAFNVNSTSKEAWKAMLASIYAENARLNEIDWGTPSGLSKVEPLDPATSGKARFSRVRIPNSEPPGLGAQPTLDSQHFFLGPRDISAEQLDTLAELIVEEVQTRGPFLSMAEFVNRQLGSPSDLTLKGALQAAIDRSEINTDTGELAALSDTGYEISPAQVADYKLTNPEAATGRSDQGALGHLTQADLLVALGNAATVRSDTFRIRSYGEARDPSGNIVSRAWCEAVVQRTPDYVSPENAPQAAPGELESVNTNFGRSFVVTSFRWLTPAEVNDASST